MAIQRYSRLSISRLVKDDIIIFVLISNSSEHTVFENIDNHNFFNHPNFIDPPTPFHLESLWTSTQSNNARNYSSWATYCCR